MAAVTGPLARRCAILDDLAAAGVEVNHGVAFRGDDALERAYQKWITAGRPRCFLRIDNGPEGREDTVLTPRESDVFTF